MNVVCIMQARLGSSRLPGKVLKLICGKTVLEHDINRLSQAKYIDEIVVATTKEKNDDKIVDEAKRLGVKYFRGSESDVLSRYYYAAKENKADVVIRVTSDCPCLDYKIMDDMINRFFHDDRKYDYFSNTIIRTFPRGYDIEIFSFKVLEEAFKNAKLDYEKEHVTPYIYNKKNKYRLGYYKCNKDYSKYRVTLDTIEDFEVISNIYNELYLNKPLFLLDDVIEFLEHNAEIADINANVEQKKLGE